MIGFLIMIIYGVLYLEMTLTASEPFVYRQGDVNYYRC